DDAAHAARAACAPGGSDPRDVRLGGMCGRRPAERDDPSDPGAAGGRGVVDQPVGGRRPARAGPPPAPVLPAHPGRGRARPRRPGPLPHHYRTSGSAAATGGGGAMTDTGDPPPFSLELARAYGRHTLRMLPAPGIWYWPRSEANAALKRCRELAKYLADADTVDGAKQLAGLLGAAAEGGRPGYGTHRMDLVHDLRAVTDEASLLAAGRNPYVARRARQPAGAAATGGAVALGITHRYVDVERVPVSYLVHKWTTAGADLGRMGRLVLGAAVRVLPVPAQSRYAEEYGSEL